MVEIVDIPLNNGKIHNVMLEWIGDFRASCEVGVTDGIELTRSSKNNFLRT